MAQRPGDLFGDLGDYSVPGPPAAPGAISASPLAERMRPQDLDEWVGPPAVAGPESFLGRAIAADRVPSLVLWGPPGSGKTTLGRIIARRARARFVDFSAVSAGVKEVKAVLEDAAVSRRRGGRTLLFLDEIHRFNRAQQDVLLPHTESGDVTLVGATTENPSFELNGALLSRLRVVVLPPLCSENLVALLRRALADPERGLGGRVDAGEDALSWIAAFSDGDARRALNALEAAASQAPEGGTLTPESLQRLFSRKVLLHDKDRESHYDLVSALHKSLRDSDVDASLYWLARLLEGGEDPLFVARRLVRAASEDVGLADPGALSAALAARDAVHFLGMPEGALALAQAAVHLALAPKSNALYVAWGEAIRDIGGTLNEPPPPALRNAPTATMRQAGYGEGYVYAHDRIEGTAGLRCLPDSLEGRDYYRPAGRGREERLRRAAAEIRALRLKLRAEREGGRGTCEGGPGRIAG